MTSPWDAGLRPKPKTEYEKRLQSLDDWGVLQEVKSKLPPTEESVSLMGELSRRVDYMSRAAYEASWATCTR